MNIYTYKDEEVSHFPVFEERPWMPKGSNVIEVQNPEDADFIICPVALHRIKSKNQNLRLYKNATVEVETLKYWQSYEKKHVFFDCSDFEVSFDGTSALLIRCNLRKFMLKDVNTISWFWPVEDLKDYTNIANGGLKFDVSFHGWLSSDIRKDTVNSCIAVFGEKFDFKTYNDFYGKLKNTTEQAQRRYDFLKSQQESKILLAPQSIPGVFPYRFYEAMSSARIPALFCTGYYLPFQDKIDWDKCTLRFDADQASNAGKLIKKFLDNTSNSRIIEMSQYGRQMWYEWLNRDKQPELISYVLEKYKSKNEK